MFCLDRKNNEKDYVVAEFGEYQKWIDKQHGVFNEMYLLAGSKQGKKTFLMILEVGKNTDIRIRIRFEKRHSLFGSIYKSVIHCEIDKGVETYKLETHLDELEFDALCAQWLYTLLFVKKYTFRKLTLTLPPRHQTKTIEKCAKKHNDDIGELHINVAKDEKDLGVVDWWLSRFRSPVQHLQIVSNAKIQLTPNIVFKKSDFVEICGQSNVSVDFIKTLRGDFFMHRAMKREHQFTDDQIKEIITHLHETNCFKELHFQQESNQYPPYPIKTWLKKKYPGAHQGINYFAPHKIRGVLFHFKKTQTAVTLGNIRNVDDITDPKQWVDYVRRRDLLRKVGLE